MKSVSGPFRQAQAVRQAQAPSGVEWGSKRVEGRGVLCGPKDFLAVGVKYAVSATFWSFSGRSPVDLGAGSVDQGVAEGLFRFSLPFAEGLG
jgi:hypothetical protein